MLHYKSNKPEFNLSNNDILKSSPHCAKFMTARQPSNPLEPIYNLPKVESIPLIIPKYIRDNIQVHVSIHCI